MVSSTIFMGIGYVLSLSMRASDQSYDTIIDTSASNEDMREATAILRDELKAARRDSVVLLNGGATSSIEFSYAIESPGPLPAWGVFERDLFVNEDDCAQPDWTVRYATQGGGPAPPLVRTIIDDTGNVRHTRTLFDAVEEFQITESGDVWVVELTAQQGGGRHEEEFDVRTRDQ